MVRCVVAANGDAGSPIASRQNPALDELWDTASVSVAAETLLHAVEPDLDKLFEILMGEFGKCAPELGSLLDFRAKLMSVWTMKSRLKRNVKAGMPAREAFLKMWIEKGDF